MVSHSQDDASCLVPAGETVPAMMIGRKWLVWQAWNNFEQSAAYTDLCLLPKWSCRLERHFLAGVDPLGLPDHAAHFLKEPFGFNAGRHCRIGLDRVNPHHVAVIPAVTG